MREQSRILVDGMTPIPKVVAGTAAGALTVLLVWLVGFWGVQVPEEISAAVTVLLVAGTAYLKR